jgi:hypothetical protein
MQRLQGEDYGQMIEDLAETELLGPPQGKWREKGRVVRKERVEPLHKDFEDLYEDCDPEHWYLQDRGIDPDTCKRLQLKYDPRDSRGEERILFPVWNHKKEFFGYTGRAIHGDVDPKVRDYHGLPKRAMLLGIHLHEQADYIVIAEGLFDYAKGQAMGFPVVATMFSSLTDLQADILRNIGKPVYGLLDNDAAGKAGNLIAAKQLLGHQSFMSVRWPKEYRVRDVSGEEKQATDVGMLDEDELARMIDKAQLYRIID